MNKVQLTGTALAISAAAMFSMAPVFAADATSTATIACKGINSCKGQGACKTATNSCKGQNTCKGQGLTKTTQAECTKAGGTVAEESTGGTGGGTEQ